MHTDLKNGYDTHREAKQAADAIRKRTRTPMAIYKKEGKFYLTRRFPGKKHGRFIKDKISTYRLNKLRQEYESIFHERKIITEWYGIPRSTETIGRDERCASYNQKK